MGKNEQVANWNCKTTVATCQTNVHFFREAFERKKWLEVGIILGFFHGKGGGVPVPTFLHQKNGNFSGKNNMLRIA